MKYNLFIPACLLLIYTSANGQTVKFKGQLILDKIIIKNYTVIADGKPSTTDDSGIFETVVNNTATQIKIQPSDQRYVILYPQGGRILIPKDPTLVTEIIIGNFKSNEFLKEYLSVSKQLKDSIGKSKTEIQSLHVQLDSVLSVLHQLNYTETDLRSAKEIQEGKDRNFYDITKDLQDYARKAQDLVSAFKYVSDYAFSNHNALEQLVEAVNNYNIIYEKLEGKNIFYQKVIGDYWSEEQQNNFKNIIELALVQIHRNKIYPLSDLIHQIRDYFNGSQNKDLKISIQQKITLIVPELNPLLTQLQDETNKFTQSLIQ